MSTILHSKESYRVLKATPQLGCSLVYYWGYCSCNFNRHFAVGPELGVYCNEDVVLVGFCLRYQFAVTKSVPYVHNVMN